MKRKNTHEMAEQKNVSFRRLAYEALPEMWSFQILAALLLAIPASILTTLITSVAESTGAAVTTANLKAVLLSWRAPVMLLLGILLVFCYIIVELFAQVNLCDDILNGRRVSVRREIGKGARSMRRFLTPAGILILLYVFIAVPLCGIGFSITLTEAFYIPNFIMDVIRTTPLYAVGYALLIFLLAWAGYRSIFSVHAVLIDGMTPSEARKASVRIIKEHGRKFVGGILKLLLLFAAIQIAAYLLFVFLPGIWLERLGAELPRNQFGAVPSLDSLTEETAAAIIGYRILCAFAVLMGTYLSSIVLLLCGAYLMLRFTRYYLDYTRDVLSEWPERPKKSRYRRKLLGMIGMFVLIFFCAVIVGIAYEEYVVYAEPVKIIAHRAGGTLVSENSIDGLYAAIDHGCYASEIDVQRTKDGYYIINHDNDFKRLTGVAKAPQDMTLEEILTLRIRDTTGNGGEFSVATIEEMLNIIKGKEKLFIELKGATADRQMADDMVRIVREMDCVDDVVLISLSYDVIEYAETCYPEFETGTLFFAGIGDVSKLNCDLLIMEEEMATPARIAQIHSAGKQAVVWTVNTETSMYRFLDSDIDAVITDEIELAERVRAKLDARTELKVLQDRLSGFWN